jgi:PTS system galactitol-specific IIA component
MNQIILPFLSKELILVGLEVATAREAIRLLADSLHSKGYVKDTFVEAVLKREELYPTGIPTEIPVAIPHTDVEHCLQPGISVGILKSAVQFYTMSAPDQPIAVRLIFVLSVVNPSVQVGLLTRLVDFCQQSAQLQKLIQSKTAQEVLHILQDGLGIDREDILKTQDEFTLDAVEHFEIVIRHPSGLHARPAAMFVQTAKRFPCEIFVSNLENSKPAANAKSIISVLSLGVSCGHRIRVQAKGERAAEALHALRTLIENNFGEGID